MQNIKQTVTQKDICINALLSMDLDAYTVLDFDEQGKVYLSDLSPSLLPSDIRQRMQDFETRTGNRVYAIIHDLVVVPDCYCFLYVSKHRVDFPYCFTRVFRGVFRCFAYCDNLSDPSCSKSGCIYVANRNGNLVRVG